jgi:16S rRNA (cytidine1402-2'-O)-methyltransferase
VISCHEHNESARVAELVEAVRDGATVLVVTDAGMPSVSDPGLRAVRAVLDAGLAVTAVPGPSAVLTALALSGLATDRFCFEGFLSRKAGQRRRALADLASEPRTMVFFEAPHRLADTLAAMAEVFGPERPAAVCRELTKTYEEVRRHCLGDLVEWARGEVRGEITLVVAGRPAPGLLGVEDVATLVGQVRAKVATGQRLKEAVAEVAEASGARKRDLYDAVTRGPVA